MRDACLTKFALQTRAHLPLTVPGLDALCNAQHGVARDALCRRYALYVRRAQLRLRGIGGSRGQADEQASTRSDLAGQGAEGY